MLVVRGNQSCEKNLTKCIVLGVFTTSSSLGEPPAPWLNWWSTLMWCLWPSIRFVESINPLKGCWQWEGILWKESRKMHCFGSFHNSFKPWSAPSSRAKPMILWCGVSDPPLVLFSPFINQKDVGSERESCEKNLTKCIVLGVFPTVSSLGQPPAPWPNWWSTQTQFCQLFSHAFFWNKFNNSLLLLLCWHRSCVMLMRIRTKEEKKIQNSTILCPQACESVNKSQPRI